MTKLKVGELVELTHTSPTVPKHLAIYTGFRPADSDEVKRKKTSQLKPYFIYPYYSFRLLVDNNEIGIYHRECEWLNSKQGGDQFINKEEGNTWRDLTNQLKRNKANGGGYCEIKVLK